jgi:hypothetical protein
MDGLFEAQGESLSAFIYFFLLWPESKPVMIFWIELLKNLEERDQAFIFAILCKEDLHFPGMPRWSIG